MVEKSLNSLIYVARLFISRARCVKKANFSFLIAILIGLSACEQPTSASSLFENYQHRLANTLSVNTEVLAEMPSLKSYPPRRQLKQSIPALKINLLEFLKLSHCELQRHVGQRNSGLGRVMESTQQFIYDVKFIHLAQVCLSTLSIHSPLYNVVEQALAHKRTHLKTNIWNATFATQEFTTLFSLGAKPLSIAELESGSLQLERALERLLVGYSQADALSVDAPFIADLEGNYQVITSSKWLGRIRLSLQYVTFALGQTDALLQQRIEGRPLCFNGQTNEHFHRVENVFHKYYIGDIQPYIAKLHQQSERLFYLLDQLLLIQQPPESFMSFWEKVYRNDTSEWQQFTAAVSKHTQHLQGLFKQCGRLPS